MQTKTKIAALAFVLATVTSSSAHAQYYGSRWHGSGYGGYGYGAYGYARAYPVSAYDTGYFWGPPSRPGIYGGGF